MIRATSIRPSNPRPDELCVRESLVRRGWRRLEARQLMEARRRGALHLDASLPREEVAHVAHSSGSPVESGPDAGHTEGHPGPTAEDVSHAGGPPGGAPEPDGPLFGRRERSEPPVERHLLGGGRRWIPPPVRPGWCPCDEAVVWDDESGLCRTSHAAVFGERIRIGGRP